MVRDLVPVLPLRLIMLRFALFKHLDGAHHAIPRIRCIVPALHLHPLALQILVNREEVRNLLQQVRIDVGVIPNVGKA